MKRKIYTYKGITGNLKDITTAFGKNYVLVAKRLERGMTIDEALELPNIKKQRKNAKLYSYNGDENKTVGFYAKKYNIPDTTLHARIVAGRTMEEAINYNRSEDEPTWKKREDLSLRGRCKAENKDYEEVLSIVKQGYSEEEALQKVTNPHDESKERIYRKLYMIEFYNKQAQNMQLNDRNQMKRYREYCKKYGDTSIDEWIKIDENNKRLSLDRIKAKEHDTRFVVYHQYRIETNEEIPFATWKINKRKEKFYLEVTNNIKHKNENVVDYDSLIELAKEKQILSENELEILNLYVNKCLSYRALGDQVGFSGSRINQFIKIIINKLKEII